MIKHVVCWKLKEDSPEARIQAKNMLLSMKGKVPSELMRTMEVGTDFLRSPRSYDVILQVTLEDAAALEAYQNDPYHAGVVKPYMAEVTASGVSMDYLLDE